MAFNKKHTKDEQERNIEQALEDAASPDVSYKKIEIKKGKVKEE